MSYQNYQPYQGQDVAWQAPPPQYNQPIGASQPPPPVYNSGQPMYPPIPGDTSTYQGYTPEPSKKTRGGATPLLDGGGGGGGGGAAMGSAMSSPVRFQDVPFALMFIFTFIAVLVIFAAGYENSYLNRPNKDHSESAKGYKDVVAVCIGTMFAGLFVSYFWMLVLKTFAKQMIYLTLTFNIFMCMVGAVLCILAGSPVGAIVLLIGAAIGALFFFFWRWRIPFATVMLQTTVGVVNRYPAMVAVSFGSILASIAMSIIWGLAFVCVASYEDEDERNTVAIFLVFSWFWAAQIIKNVAHMTCAGTFASWYFAGDNMPPNPTLGSLKRATTTSFGSVCFGSLLIAAIQFLRFIVRHARENGRDSLVAACAECIIRCLQDILEYFNIYAFTQCAIYGKSYCQAAKDTWALFSGNGIDILVNDDLIGPVLVLVAWLAGVFTACIGGVWALVVFTEHKYGDAATGLVVACMVFAFFVGALECTIVMECVRSGVACLFVCFAEAPEVLARTQPDLNLALQNTYGGRIGFFR